MSPGYGVIQIYYYYYYYYYYYISAQKLETKRSKSFPASISLQTKAIRSWFRVSGTAKYPPNFGKSSRSWLKLRCAQGGLSYSFSLKVKLGYILGQKLEDKRSKRFCIVHFTANQFHQE